MTSTCKCFELYESIRSPRINIGAIFYKVVITRNCLRRYFLGRVAEESNRKKKRGNRVVITSLTMLFRAYSYTSR